MDISVNSLKKTGLFPFNQNVFRDNELGAFSESSHYQETRSAETQEDAHTRTRSDEHSHSKDTTLQAPQPSCRNTDIVRPVEISPLQEFPSNVGLNSSRCGSATVITSSPYKTCLAESIGKKNKEAALKESVHGENKMKVTTKKKKFRPPTMKKLHPNPKPFVPEYSEDSNGEGISLHDRSRESDGSQSDEDAECLLCG
ncbi:hypothetical protein PR048_012476 [Dryococelus australis]|uniref:Uncharacterized protein n=1 Tax=Dryococelus australis TaxID=614101 RepID=A0ABQ9HPX0_9NEOP|nr:hypothetical protein PR048_012476 [Dryococelus australis]